MLAIVLAIIYLFTIVLSVLLIITRKKQTPLYPLYVLLSECFIMGFLFTLVVVNQSIFPVDFVEWLKFFGITLASTVGALTVVAIACASIMLNLFFIFGLALVSFQSLCEFDVNFSKREGENTEIEIRYRWAELTVTNALFFIFLILKLLL